MVRELISKTPVRMFVKVYRKGRKTRIISYMENLGAVVKTVFIESEMDLFNYTSKNRAEILRKHKIVLKNLGLID